MISYYKYLPYCGGETLIFWATVEGHTEIVKILAPLTDNPNAPTKYYRETPIHRAALFGYTEIVKILAPLTDNPNAQNYNGDTPYFLAARNGHLEICRILKSFKDFIPQR